MPQKCPPTSVLVTAANNYPPQKHPHATTSFFAAPLKHIRRRHFLLQLDNVKRISCRLAASVELKPIPKLPLVPVSSALSSEFLNCGTGTGINYKHVAEKTTLVLSVFEWLTILHCRRIILWTERHLSFILQYIRLQWVFKLWQECYYVFKACFPELPWEPFYLHPSLSSCHCCQCTLLLHLSPWTTTWEETVFRYFSNVVRIASSFYFPEVLHCWPTRRLIAFYWVPPWKKYLCGQN